MQHRLHRFSAALRGSARVACYRRDYAAPLFVDIGTDEKGNSAVVAKIQGLEKSRETEPP